MKNWLVISGKGGTGKTSITGSLAFFSNSPVLVDCDVDAADLHLLVSPENQEIHPFISGITASVNPDNCTKCGLCSELCRFGAIAADPNEYPVISEVKCEGCNVCDYFCPDNAIVTKPNLCGQWFFSDTRLGPMYHARLKPGAENSGKLVALIRKEAQDFAETNNHSLTIIDGPPGIGCPVISSITGVDLAVIVTEPSPSGRHDLLRVIELAQHFSIPVEVVINKWDLNPDYSRDMIFELLEKNIAVSGKVRFDPRVVDALMVRKTIVEYADNGAASDIHEIWNILSEKYL